MGVLFVAGDNKKQKEVPFVEAMDDLDSIISYTDASGKTVEIPDVTQRDALILGKEPNALVHCSMDWQGRPFIVAVMASANLAAVTAGGASKIRRQSQLSTEELAALWHTVAEVVRWHGTYEDIRLNAGTF